MALLPCLTEIHSDPRIWSDQDAEFLEIQNRSGQIFDDTLLVLMNGDTLHKAHHRLLDREFLVLCRNTKDSPWPCEQSSRSFSLPNNRESKISICSNDITEPCRNSTSPKSLSGKSWTRFFDSNACSQGSDQIDDFFISSSTTESGEKVSPGFADPNYDKGISNSRLLTRSILRSPGMIMPLLQIESSSPHEKISIEVYADQNLDGLPDTLLQKFPVFSGTFQAKIRFPLKDSLSQILFILPSDEYPSDDTLTLPASSNIPGALTFGELFPFPDSGDEWIELLNRGTEDVDLGTLYLLHGGRARRFAPTGRILKTGEACILAQDSAAFRKKYGPLPLMILEPEKWVSLSNRGDSLELKTSRQILLDRAIWLKESSDTRGKALTRSTAFLFNQVSDKYSVGSVGFFPVTTKTHDTLYLGQRVFSPGSENPLRIHYGSRGKSMLKIEIFELAGSRVWKKELKSPSKGILHWNGYIQGGSEKRAVPGIYIVLAEYPSGQSRRLSMVVAP